MNAPSELARLQHWMQAALVDQDQLKSCPTSYLRAVRLSESGHLAIYQRSYYMRLLKCMREQFPALCYALGQPLFDDFALDYLRQYPSVSYTLYKLGQRFPEYLADTRPDAGLPDSQQEAWVSFMLDLVLFEREIFNMFDAPGDEARGYASSTLADTHIGLQRCCKLVRSRFAVANYYASVRAQETPKLPAMQPTRLLLVRRDFVTRTLSLTEAQYLFIEGLQQGKTVDETLAEVAVALKLDYRQVSQSWNTPGGVRDHWFDAGVFVDNRCNL